MTDQSQNSDEIPELRSLPRETTPSPELENRVIAELRRAGLLNTPISAFHSRFVRPALATAAGISLFLAGWLAASFRQAESAPEAEPTYVLFLRVGPDYREGTAADEQQRVNEYGTWARGLHEKGQLVGGEKLSDDARSLVARDGVVTLLEQHGGDQGAVQGLFLIRAASFDEALEIARGCPHLRHGGIIEVRPIDPT